MDKMSEAIKQEIAGWDKFEIWVRKDERMRIIEYLKKQEEICDLDYSWFYYPHIIEEIEEM